MAVLLVRHAHAGNPNEWSAPDHLRPLSVKGIQQAEALVFSLAGYAVERVLSSPFLRCRQTVEPLALVRGVPLETVDALAEGNGRATRDLVTELAGCPVVLCTHGDVIGETLAVLGDVIGAMPGGGPRPMRKGSVWILEADPGTGRYVGARYLPPPDRLS